MCIRKHLTDLYANCTATRSTAIVSVLTVLVMVFFLWQLLFWAVVNATWGGSTDGCYEHGACWVYVSDNIYQLMYGLYPRTELWRVNALLLDYCIWMLVIVQIRGQVLRAWLMGIFIIFGPVISFYLLRGEVFGLALVSPQYWGGLCLNIIFSVLSIACAFPLGFVLAVVRKKNWGIYSFVARVLIDLIRSLPLVSLLFFASLVLPLLFRDYEGSTKIIRLFAMFTLFGSGYMAEAIRGGLQSVGHGQIESAQALGFKRWQVDLYIVYPQALEIALPSLMNLVIALFKDTTLLSTIAILDVVAIMQATTATSEWMPYSVEAYVFVGFVFWFLCYGLSIFSLRIEKSIKVGR